MAHGLDTHLLPLLPCQWDLAVDLVEVLNGLEHLTTQFSGESYAALSCVVPLLTGLFVLLKSKVENDAFRSSKRKLREQLEQHFCFPEPAPTSLPVLASSIDPFSH